MKQLTKLYSLTAALIIGCLSLTGYANTNVATICAYEGYDATNSGNSFVLSEHVDWAHGCYGWMRGKSAKFGEYVTFSGLNKNCNYTITDTASAGIRYVELRDNNATSGYISTDSYGNFESAQFPIPAAEAANCGV